MCAAGGANAAITVQIWVDEAAAAANATIAQAAGLGAADATTTVAALDLTDAPGNNSAVFSIGDFLHNPAGLDPTVAAHALNNTYMLFTGVAFLNAGANAFVVNHDDGLQLDFAGIGLVVDAPGPTPPVDTPFVVNAPSAGNYGFTLSYGEVFGGPARLLLKINDEVVGGGVPEPASWALMIAGFGGVGALVRRRRALALA
jgi:hypothetical protein